MSLGSPSLDASYDKWRTTPDEPESNFKCDRCKQDIFPDEPYYEVEGDNLCPDCAKDWLEEQKCYAKECQCNE